MSLESPLQGQNCIHPPICSFALIVMGGIQFCVDKWLVLVKQPNTDYEVSNVNSVRDECTVMDQHGERH